ncbi:hypothetical protein [Methylobacterium oryzae]|uniref:Protein of unassigned function n=1 Tax=Methylobacterium oryzae CBMB20 TaxID=693986 RepID=A0A089P0G4_9HYPH|nr:hypothetical protein [Methylobacterium oryzae]AIQ93157.1 protein of unassigned function [Methylobacterium oryzae CBMB20]
MVKRISMLRGPAPSPASTFGIPAVALPFRIKPIAERDAEPDTERKPEQQPFHYPSVSLMYSAKIGVLSVPTNAV